MREWGPRFLNFSGSYQRKKPSFCFFLKPLALNGIKIHPQPKRKGGPYQRKEKALLIIQPVHVLVFLCTKPEQHYLYKRKKHLLLLAFQSQKFALSTYSLYYASQL
jgi:V8-like Glu-specific endopeptidase